MKLSERKHNPNTFPSVFIVIVNWNGLNDTIECIKSILNISYEYFKIIVIDNGSDNDESIELAFKFPDVIAIRSETNLGFSGGNNLGIKYALKNEADYILLINNDTIVEKDFLDILVEVVVKNQSIGLAVPKINYYNNPSRIWYAGGYISKLRGAAVTIGKGKLDNFYTENKYVTFATGCCLLIDKKVINDVGLMDEKYFLYLEDADYCLRAVESGYKILCVPQSKIFHKINSSTFQKYENLPLYYVTRNRLYFTKKLFPKYIGIVYTYVLISMVIKSIYWFFVSRKNKILIVKKAFSDFKLNNLGKMKEY